MGNTGTIASTGITGISPFYHHRFPPLLYTPTRLENTGIAGNIHHSAGAIEGSLQHVTCMSAICRSYSVSLYTNVPSCSVVFFIWDSAMCFRVRRALGSSSVGSRSSKTATYVAKKRTSTPRADVLLIAPRVAVFELLEPEGDDTKALVTLKHVVEPQLKTTTEQLDTFVYNETEHDEQIAAMRLTSCSGPSIAPVEWCRFSATWLLR